MLLVMRFVRLSGEERCAVTADMLARHGQSAFRHIIRGISSRHGHIQVVGNGYIPARLRDFAVPEVADYQVAA